MKLLGRKGFARKILIVMLATVVINFAAPIKSHAESDLGGKLFNPIFQFLSTLSDIPIGALQHFMLGTTNMFDSVTLDAEEVNSKESSGGIWHLSVDEYEEGIDEDLETVDGEEEKPAKTNVKKVVHYGPLAKDDTTKYDGIIDDDGILWFDDKVKIPNILYCPEYIFANRIAALDVNFINPGTYEGGEVGSEQTSIASGALSKTIATWYKAFRNVAVVGLLSVLVYIGIRILIGSTAQDKAKYKERLKDWFVGLCLLFVMHYIMAGTMMITEVITNNLAKSMDENSVFVKVVDYDHAPSADPEDSDKAEAKENLYFKTNFMGYIRFMTQSYNIGDSAAYLIMYIALVIFTIMFTVIYLKRVLYMAFFTMIAPLVAMTYPVDKLADGKAQGFNMWVREYMMNAVIQPVHLIIYMVIMGSLLDLATSNPLYGIVAIGFLLPAEKFIKKMFRFDRGETVSPLGAVAGGALVMKGVQNLTSGLGGKGGGKDNKIRTQEKQPLTAGKRGKNDGIPAPEGVIGQEHQNENTNTNNNDSFNVEDDNHIDFSSNAFDEWNPSGATSSSSTGTGTATGINTLAGTGTSTGAGTSSGTSTDPNGAPLRINGQGNAQPFTLGTPTPPTNGWDSTSIDTTGYTPSSDSDTSNVPTSDTNQDSSDERTYGGWTFRTGQSIKGSSDEKEPGRFRRVGGAIIGKMGRDFARYKADLPDRLKDRAISGAKSLPGTVARLGAKVAGAAAVGTVAAGAALTTGDLKSAATMATGGAILGSKVGAKAGERPAQALDDGIQSISETAKSAWYTEEEKDQQDVERRKKYDEEWKLKEDNYKYLREKNMNDKKAKDFLEHENTQRFLDAGITDINLIYNARKLMDASQGKMGIDGAVARAQLAKNTAENFASSETQKKAFKENMKSKNPNLDNDQLDKLVGEIIKIKKTD